MNPEVAGQPKKRTFKKFSFRGVDLDALLDMPIDELVKLYSARARRRYELLFFFFCWSSGFGKSMQCEFKFGKLV